MEVKVTGALARDQALRELANDCHSPEDGRFCEGSPQHKKAIAMDKKDNAGGQVDIEGFREPGSGATKDSRTGKDVLVGYAVSLQGHSSITPVDEFFSGVKGKEKGRRILKDWIRKARADGLLDNPAIKIGIWHDPDHGEITIDASEQVMNRSKAIKLGRERNQQGIYGLNGEGYIPTGGTGDRE